MVKKLKRVLGNINLHHGPDSKSKMRQLGEIMWLGLKYGFSPIEYEAYRFYLKDKKMTEMLTYMSNQEVTSKLRPLIYDERMLVILNNKLLFHRFYGASGIALPKFMGFFHPESGFTNDTLPLRNLDDFKRWIQREGINQFFVKPCGGKQGFGVMAIYRILPHGNSYIFEDAEGQEWKLEKLIDGLSLRAKETRYSGYILEEVVEQHPLLNRVNQSSLNTCRLLTLKLPDNTVEAPFAIARFGRKNSYVDSWSQGGIAYGVEMDTGKLTRGSFNPQWGTTRTDPSHPDTEVNLQGLSLPYWEETIAQVKKAASITPGIKSIGWDVAITPDGPLIIEGNSTWSPIAIQSLNGGLLSSRNRDNLRHYGLLIR